MIYSYLIKHNVKPHQEDPKTSTIFGTLLAFPDDIVWEIIYNAIAESERTGLLKEVGKLSSYEFWPQWDSSGTTNDKYVEPDLFLRFEKLDVIIEAKRSDNSGQYPKEWERELRAYHNKYNENRKPILIAVGGNKTAKTEDILTKGDKHKVYKCSWLSLLSSVVNKQDQLSSQQESHLIRLCDTMRNGFYMHNVLYFKWMDSIEPWNTIQSDSISCIRNYFKTNRRIK